MAPVPILAPQRFSGAERSSDRGSQRTLESRRTFPHSRRRPWNAKASAVVVPRERRCFSATTTI
eukprot:6124534-Prymnesium_polylepis.1